MTKKRAILALIAAAAVLGGIFALGTPAGATDHPTYPHPDCEDHEYGNEYCTPTTEVTTTTVKCPPKSTTTTTVVTTTTEAPTTSTTVPATTTTSIPEPRGSAISVSRPAPVAVNPPEFHTVHSAPPGVMPLGLTG